MRKLSVNWNRYLCEITGFEACSLQPNSGAQGEYAGLMAIRAYHQAKLEAHTAIFRSFRRLHTVPTRPSAVMAGMEVVVVACDERGNIDVADLRAKAEAHADQTCRVSWSRTQVPTACLKLRFKKFVKSFTSTAVKCTWTAPT
jgi:glycine dehydrogenase